MKMSSPYQLKIEEKTFEKLKHYAKKDKRSISQEIEFMIEWYLNKYYVEGQKGNSLSSSGVDSA
jgi:hypothetical protein